MNILGLSLILGDNPLARLSIGPVVLERIRQHFPQDHPINLMTTGHDMRDYLRSLPNDVYECLSNINLITPEENLQYKGEIDLICDQTYDVGQGNRYIGFIATLLVLFVIYMIASYLLNVNHGGDVLMGNFPKIIHHLMDELYKTLSTTPTKP